MRSLVNPSQGSHFAFTRLELIACLVAVALLITIIVPALANSPARSDRVMCFNNLRRIGVAYSQFGLESRSGLPPWRLNTSEGGNANAPGKDNLFVQLSIISNDLAHPRYLADPGDTRRDLAVAKGWGNSPDGGLHHGNYRNKAISYFLGLDGEFRLPQAVLSGDRNLLAAPNAVGCSSGITSASEVRPWATGWTNAVHGLAGNLVLYDGSVVQVDSAGLRAVFGRTPLDISGAGAGALHILAPF